MPSYKVSFLVTYEVEAEDEAKAMEKAERYFYEDLGREGYRPSEIFDSNIEEL